MTGRPRDDEATAALDVPVRPVAGGPRGDRRARAASLTTIALAAGVVLFALPKGSPGPGPTSAPPPAAQASPAASPSGPLPTVRPRPRPTLQPLPEIPNQILPRAPHPAFYERRGDDLEIRQWVPGADRLELAAMIRGAFADMENGDNAFVMPSPDGRAAAILSFGLSEGASRPVRIVTDTGGIVWDATMTHPQATWSADSRYVALAEDDDAWSIVDLAATPPGVLSVDLPPAPAEAEPSPSQFEPEPREGYVMIAFAADVSYLYGGTFAPDGGWRATIRIAVSSGRVEPIDELPVTGPAAATSVGFGVFLERDAITGRTALFDHVGPVVREPDGTVAFRLDVPGAVLAMVWSDDGRLITVETDGRDEIGTIRVTPWEPDGTQGPPLMVTNHPAWVPLTDYRDGYLLLGFVTDFPSASDHPLRLALLRLDDGATSTIDIDTDLMSGVLGLGWYEPHEPVVIFD
jgi:hypothetical protein